MPPVPPGRGSAVIAMTRSSNSGRTWSNTTLMGPPGAPQALYSPSSDTVFLFGKSPNLIDNGTRPDVPNACFMSKSTDEGQTWSPAEPMNVTNAFAPHYGGGMRTHGIELARGLLEPLC